LLGCRGGGQTGDEQTGNAGSVLQELRGTAARVAANGDLPNSASDDGWAFGWKFYAEEARPNENVFFSPYSISAATAMLVAGANGETKAEIDGALSFSADDGPAFHQARNAISSALAARNHDVGEDSNGQVLRVSNDLWLDPGFHPLPSFLDTLSGYYGAGVFLAPFSKDAEAARQAVNAKVATDTEQLIRELLPLHSVDGAVVVLTNALYFKSNWANQFSKGLTADEPFVNAAGETKSVAMMHGMGGLYYTGSDYQAIALPYSHGELELVAIMPAAGTFGQFSANLSAETVAKARAALVPALLDLRFPKFEIDRRVPLAERLQALGMQRAFTDKADFSRLGDGVFISDALHQATLSLDEDGTEAAAATAFVVVPSSSSGNPPVPIPVVFDHPFVFFIRDIETNALLFVGHFASP
jgi:serpin B